MTQKKPRSPHSFVTPIIGGTVRGLNTSSSRCRRHSVPRCAAVKLLVVELSEVLRGPRSAEMKNFSERVSVDRSSAQDTTYVLYSSQLGYGPSMERIKSSDLIDPDALSALDGTELYQRRYRTPDPYWAKMVCKDWDPKPTLWVIGQFFEDQVAHAVDDSEEYGLVYECKDGKQNRGELCEKIGDKLKEMGIRARVSERGESNSVVVTPAAGSVVDVIGFCQMMLRIPEDMTYVFGSDELVENCVVGKESFGICAKGSKKDWRGAEDRVFVSEKEGVEALMDGVMHHAIF